MQAETKTLTPAAASVVRVRQGAGAIGADGQPRSVFSVTLSRPAGDELGIVAAAADPEKPTLKIPAAGTPHPLLPGFFARPPEIHSVGLRYKGGAWIARQSCFYNVLVRYEKNPMPKGDNGRAD